MPPLPPTEREVAEYIKQWADTPRYALLESSLSNVIHCYPEHDDPEQVLIKVTIINSLYSTKIFDVYSMVDHIITIQDIKGRLNGHDLGIVNDIATIGNRRFYSFATKYCFLHKPDLYPIYDSYIARTLRYFQTQENFHETVFNQDTLRSYPTYCDILQSFKNYYNLNNFSNSDIDKYLWQTGKEFFP